MSNNTHKQRPTSLRVASVSPVSHWNSSFSSGAAYGCRRSLKTSVGTNVLIFCTELVATRPSINRLNQSIQTAVLTEIQNWTVSPGRQNAFQASVTDMFSLLGVNGRSPLTHQAIGVAEDTHKMRPDAENRQNTTKVSCINKMREINPPPIARRY